MEEIRRKWRWYSFVALVVTIISLFCYVRICMSHFLSSSDSYSIYSFWDFSTSIIIAFIVFGTVLLSLVLKEQLNLLSLLLDYFLIQVPLLVLLCYFYYHGTMLNQSENPLWEKVFVLGIILSFLFLILIFYFRQVQQITEKQKKEMEQVKNACSLEKAKLLVLQAQLKPHFFFNNLSVLSSLINIDPQKSIDFIQDMSNLYRNVLLSIDKETISLVSELEIISHYISLLKIRYGNTVIFNLPEIDPAYRCYYIPPLSIQHLIENCIKHNARTADHPLVIDVSIKIEQNTISVRNNLRPLNGMIVSSGTGLNNLKERYKLQKLPVPTIKATDKDFEVFLALIKNI